MERHTTEEMKQPPEGEEAKAQQQPESEAATDSEDAQNDVDIVIPRRTSTTTRNETPLVEASKKLKKSGLSRSKKEEAVGAIHGTSSPTKLTKKGLRTSKSTRQEGPGAIHVTTDTDQAITQSTSTASNEPAVEVPPKVTKRGLGISKSKKHDAPGAIHVTSDIDQATPQGTEAPAKATKRGLGASKSKAVSQRASTGRNAPPLVVAPTRQAKRGLGASKSLKHNAPGATHCTAGTSTPEEEADLSAREKMLSAQDIPRYMQYVSDFVVKDMVSTTAARSIPDDVDGPTAQASAGSQDMLPYVSGLSRPFHENEVASLEGVWQSGEYVYIQADDSGLQIGSNHRSTFVTNSGLAVARPIVNDDLLEEGGYAEQIEPGLMQKRQAEQERKTRQYLAVCLIVSCVLLGGLILLLIFVVGGADSESVALMNEGNSTMPQATVASDETLLFSLLPQGTTTAIHKDTSSPQAQAFDWLSNDPSFRTYPDWRKLQRFALATFYYATNGHKWNFKTNWMSYDHSECEWVSLDYYGLTETESELVKYGLTATFPAIEKGMCNSTNMINQGRVERLVLLNNNLRGSLPPELSLLTSMRVFVTLGNPLGTTIPSEIGQLPNLELLGLAIGDIKGSIPSQLAQASRLTHLILFHTQLSGTVPTQLGTLSNLKGLMLDESKLEGSLPTELGLLSNAIWLSTFKNEMKGSIPSQLGQLSLLRVLPIFANYYNGQLPSELGMLSSLRELTIGRNELTGTLPTELGQLKKLEVMDFSNQLLSGSLPSEIGSLQSLTVLKFYFTLLSGSLPQELFLLSNMQELNTRDNSLTGRISSEVGLLSHMRQYRLELNMMSGKLPTEIGLARALHVVHLHHNLFTGALPSELGLLNASGSVLDLSYNSLSGTIPSQLGQTSVKWLNLASNTLQGTIPSELGMLADDSPSLEVQNKKPTIPIPSSQWDLLSVEEWPALRLNGNLLSGFVPAELGSFKLLNISDNPYLQGRIPDEVCAILKREDSYINSELNSCWLHFDCTKNLCGCAICSCSDDHQASN